VGMVIIITANGISLKGVLNLELLFLLEN